MLFIFEGPDGGGKTSAIRKVLREFPHIEHRPRFATSAEGPKPGMDDLIDQDANYTSSLMKDVLYDRHGLISELVYGPVCRGKLPGRFTDPWWLRRRVADLAHRSLVIWCLPPWRCVEMNVRGTEGIQMPGVREHLPTIYASYQSLRAVWPGRRAYTHDYTMDRFGTQLLDVVAVFTGKD